MRSGSRHRCLGGRHQHRRRDGDRAWRGRAGLGNCSPDEQDKLHDDYKQKCGQSDRLGACMAGPSPSQRSARRQVFGQCARARE
ncbi:hypothetical protein EJP69_19150 [Variovorax gossypii]|uniref:Uncharacterized protein n=1 Tax=Variovorax gossypii TaxID=1679495 RepID=A0A431TIY2_9BURK|nr:hypothetical protein EJP69_19150 [Variovorax gossypii]